MISNPRIPSTQEGWALVVNNKPNTLLNDYYSDLEDESATQQFPRFGELPIELRWTIWRLTLPKNRLIGVRLRTPKKREDREQEENHRILSKKNEGSLSPDEKRESSEGSERAKEDPDISNRPNKTKEGSAETLKGDPSFAINNLDYRAELTTKHSRNPLLAVDRNARRIALDFYRVHIPCIHPYTEREGYLYLNPELDILQVETNEAPDTLVHLLVDIKKRDPRGLGLINLCVGGVERINMELPSDPSHFRKETVDAFQEIVTNLKRIYFYSVGRAESRCMFISFRMAHLQYNRSFPLHAHNEEFDLLDCDPRPISEDMVQVALCHDPRAMVYAWIEMERHFKIDRSQHMPQMQFLVNASVGVVAKPPQIRSRQDAIAALEAEAENWHSLWENGTFSHTDIDDPDTPKKLSRTPLPAVGFWIIPVAELGSPKDVRGNAPSGHHRDIQWHYTRVMNLSKLRPQLGLFRLD